MHKDHTTRRGRQPGYALALAGALGVLVGCGPSSDGGTGASAGQAGAGTGGSAGTGGDKGFGGVTIEGAACTIAAPTLWKAGVYAVQCNVDVKDSLTIEPGAVIKFASGYHLDVNQGGSLTATGTEHEPIVLTSIKDDAHGGDSGGDGSTTGTRGDWGCESECGGLNIRGNGSALEYVLVLYATSGGYVQADSVRIAHSTFAHHKAYGLVLDRRASLSDVTMDENAFFDNQGYPLRMERAIFLNGGNLFHDPENPDTTNGKQCIELDSDIDGLTMFGVTELGFLLSGHRIRGELLLPEGVIFKSEGEPIFVEGDALFANGTNMFFTSYADDATGGDCTGNGNTPPKAGDWTGLWIDDGQESGYAVSADYIRYPAESGTMPLPVLQL